MALFRQTGSLDPDPLGISLGERERQFRALSNLARMRQAEQVETAHPFATGITGSPTFALRQQLGQEEASTVANPWARWFHAMRESSGFRPTTFGGIRNAVEESLGQPGASLPGVRRAVGPALGGLRSLRQRRVKKDEYAA